MKLTDPFRCLLLGCLLMSCSTPETPQGVAVQVDRVVSGNTLEVSNPRETFPQPQRVRLLGIDAPDLKQDPWGEEAKQQLERWTEGHSVVLETDTELEDIYGRQLAYVWRDGELINEELLKQGMAIAVVRSPNTKYQQRFADAQEWARLMGHGIWNPKQPLRQTPSQFRRLQR